MPLLLLLLKVKALARPLDFMITEREIRKAAEKLKNNKSPFSDKIRNEIIKASIDTLMPVYEKLFNSILNQGTMPQTWCGGLIAYYVHL